MSSRFTRWLRPDTIWVFVVALVVALVVIAAGIAATLLGDVEGPARVAIAPGITGIATGKSYAYVLDSASGVVLVDSGSDHALRAVNDELTRRGHTLADVKAVLLTGACPFTVAGLTAIPNVPVYVGADDEEATRQPRLAKAPLLRLFGRLSSHRHHDNPIVPVPAGSRFTIDGLSAEAVATPGFTDGSRSYLIGDIAFVGGGFTERAEHLHIASGWLAHDGDAIVASMQRLAAHPFTWIAGATFPATSRGRAMYDAWRSSIPDDQRVSMP